MANEAYRRFRVAHRVLIGLVAVAAIMLSVAAGLFSRDRITAQSDSNVLRGGPTGGVPGGVQGGVQGGVPGGVPGGVFTLLADPALGQSDEQRIWDISKELEAAPAVGIKFKNSREAPLAITDARIKMVKSPASNSKKESFVLLPIITLTNNAQRAITGFTLELENAKPEQLVFFERVKEKIEPNAFYTTGKGRGRFVKLRDEPDIQSVEVVGVVFEDGERWGVVPPPPPPPSPPGEPPTGEAPTGEAPSGLPKVIRRSGGVMMESAIKRVSPQYPEIAKEAKASGAVVVEVTIDEEGNVIEARALTGHPLLRDAAVEAARQWQFKPTYLSGTAVKVVATLTFNFTP